MTYDTDRMGLDGYNRRSNRAVTFIESPGFKITQTVVTLILLPLAAWGGGQVLDKLAKIDASINLYATDAATKELRLRNLESESVRAAADLRVLQDKVSSVDYAQRRLDERSAILGGKR